MPLALRLTEWLGRALPLGVGLDCRKASKAFVFGDFIFVPEAEPLDSMHRVHQTYLNSACYANLRLAGPASWWNRTPPGGLAVAPENRPDLEVNCPSISLCCPKRLGIKAA
jgi:hypothetical protein